jgi:hypothetical protein
MSDPLHDVFEILEPPPGGLRELRHRIRAERTPRRAWFGGLAVAAAAAAVLLVTVPRGPDPGSELADRLACDDPVLAGLLCDQHDPMVAVSAEHQARLALVPVASSNERVLIFRVASAGAPLEAEDIRGISDRD